MALLWVQRQARFPGDQAQHEDARAENAASVEQLSLSGDHQGAPEQHSRGGSRMEGAGVSWGGVGGGVRILVTL